MESLAWDRPPLSKCVINKVTPSPDCALNQIPTTPVSSIRVSTGVLGSLEKGPERPPLNRVEKEEVGTSLPFRDLAAPRLDLNPLWSLDLVT